MDQYHLLRADGRRFSLSDRERTIVPSGDNLSFQLVFDLPASDGGIDLSSMAAGILLEQPGADAYTRLLAAAPCDETGRIRKALTLHRTDTAVAGLLRFQLRFTAAAEDDEVVWQSFSDYFYIEPSLDAEAEAEELSPTVFDEAKTACLEAVADAQEIKDSIVPPEIMGSGNWSVNGQDTGKPSRGVKGETGDTGPTGPQGEQGTGLSLLGSYDTEEELLAAHPTGDVGEAYLVAGDLYVWDGVLWSNIGQIQGPQGNPTNVNGKTGESITLTAADVGAPTSSAFLSHTGDSTIHLAIASIFNAIYPVGSYYTTASSAFDPNVSFAGTWERTGKGCVIVGVNEADTAFNEAGKTGGEKTHKLTVAEMPTHDHLAKCQNVTYGSGGSSATIFGGTDPNYPGVNSTGGDQYHNNMPPYLTAYIWRRKT